MDIVAPNIETTPSIAELSQALAKAQGLIANAEKDKLNPHFRSKYADLASVWEACKEPLSVNGLAVIQIPQASGDKVTVTTILSHGSGEWIRGSLTIKVTKVDAQGVGSAITYARRYMLSAMVGVSPDDDDAEAAVRAPTQSVTKQTTDFSTIPYKGTEGQKRFLNSLCEEKGVPKELRGKLHEDFVANQIISTKPMLDTAIDKFMEGQEA